VECTENWWRVKACLWHIDKYRDAAEGCGERIREIIKTAYDCKLCNSHCNGGAAFTLEGGSYRKCVGCCFYFSDLEDAEWNDLAGLIRAEYAASITT